MKQQVTCTRTRIRSMSCAELAQKGKKCEVHTSLSHVRKLDLNTQICLHICMVNQTFCFHFIDSSRFSGYPCEPGNLRLYLFFNSISVISGRWAGDNEKLCPMEPSLRLERSQPRAGIGPRTTRSIGQCLIY